MTPTLGDFLTIAGQRIAAAEGYRGRLRAAGHTEIISELDRLLTVMARYACDGVQPSGSAVTSPVPTRQELTIIGIRLTLLHSTESMHRVAQTSGNCARTGHPIAADLRAASDALIAGRDLVHTHDFATSHTGSDPLWASALNARPVTAALMRQLSGYAPHLAQLTARLLRPARNRAIPLVTREALQDARKWLTLAASAHADEQGQPGLDLNTLLLHSIPANLPPPRQPPANSDLSAPELCAGATATAARLRHLAHRSAGQPAWPSPAAAACWRHNALAAAIIGHNSELLLRTLADRSRQLGLAEHHHEALQRSADAMRTAWQSWQAVTHAWDPLTTGTSNRLSLVAAELDDLVLWIGRLARTGTWTPAHANVGRPRAPADLARTPDDVTIVLVVVGRTADAATQVARQDMQSAERASAAGWIYSPARLLPDNDDLVHVYRYRHASPGQIGELRAAYHHAITATETVTATLDTLLTDLCTPGEPYALARALQRSPVAAHPRHQDTKPLSSRRTTAAELGPGAGDAERLMHSLKVSDPELLFRAIALDHATRDLTAEALTKVEQLNRLNRDAKHATGCHSKKRRNSSARLAAQDLPGAGQALTPAAPDPQASSPTDLPSARKPISPSSTRQNNLVM
jgi:hypothetical protein